MSGFFNTEAANFVQHVSICFEFVGLVLTFIEVLYPKTADKIEQTIDWCGDYFQYLSLVVIEIFTNNAREKMFFPNIGKWLDTHLNFHEKKDGVGRKLNINWDNENRAGLVVMLVWFVVNFGLVIAINPWFETHSSWKPLSNLPVALIIVISLPLLLVVWSIGLILCHTSIYVIFKSFSWPIAFLNRLTHGHALGSIGLILAFVGFVGEGYQLLTIYFGN